MFNQVVNSNSNEDKEIKLKDIDINLQNSDQDNSPVQDTSQNLKNKQTTVNKELVRSQTLKKDSTISLISNNNIIQTNNASHNETITHAATLILKSRIDFKGYTKKDIDCLNEEDKIKYTEEETFGAYFKNIFLTDHPVLNLYFTKSVMEPLKLRISHLFFSIALNLFFNAAFYTDEYIEKQASNQLFDDEEEVKSY